jgi:chitin disaccharide deacetylase
MKRIIINADDFGLSRSINSGIVEALQFGILTSASLMVNMPGFEDALRLIKEKQLQCIGIHLNVVRGMPILSPPLIGSLCFGRRFRNDITGLTGGSYVSHKIREDFEQECRAQIEKALSEGIQITHVDSEKHIHLIRPLFKIVARIMRDYGIRRIRLINESPFRPNKANYFPDLFSPRFYASGYFSCCDNANREIIERYNLTSTNYFYGLSNTGNMVEENYVWILSRLKEGTTEIMCHPGYIDYEWREYPLVNEVYSINTEREKELRPLLNPKLKEYIAQRQITRISYRDL